MPYPSKLCRTLLGAMPLPSNLYTEPYLSNAPRILILSYSFLSFFSSLFTHKSQRSLFIPIFQFSGLETVLQLSRFSPNKSTTLSQYAHQVTILSIPTIPSNHNTFAILHSQLSPNFCDFFHLRILMNFKIFYIIFTILCVITLLTN